MSRLKLTYAQQSCVKKAGLALQRAAPLWPGARVGVAVSGGVDSLVLLKTLKLRQAIVPFPVEIMALHCNPGFNVQNHAGFAQWLAREGISGHIETTDHGPVAHSQKNKSVCFLCSWFRRKRLFELCRQYSLTHLAFGHNADDMTDTFLLNFFRNGIVRGLPIGEKFFDGRLVVIRPLLLVEKKSIIQAARQWQLPVWDNCCPSAGNTARAEMAKLLAQINAGIPGAAKSALNALARWQLENESSNPVLPNESITSVSVKPAQAQGISNHRK